MYDLDFAITLWRAQCEIVAMLRRFYGAARLQMDDRLLLTIFIVAGNGGDRTCDIDNIYLVKAYLDPGCWENVVADVRREIDFSETRLTRTTI